MKPERNRAAIGTKPSHSRAEPLPEPKPSHSRTKPSHFRTKPNHTQTEPLPDPNQVSRSVSGSEKTSQLRFKIASSSTTLFLWSLHGHYAVTTRSLRGSLRSLRGHYGHNMVYAFTAVTTRSLRGHYGRYAVTTRSLRRHYGHYAVTTQSDFVIASEWIHYIANLSSLIQ